MEIKKTPDADLENKKGIFLEIGLVVVLGLLLVAFEWTTGDVKVAEIGNLMIEEFEAEEIPITRQEEMKPPPPPPPKPLVIEQLDIVDDDTEIENELDMADTEADDKTAVVIMDMPAEEEADEEQIFFVVEKMPAFPGGELALRKHIAESVKYPDIARDNGVQGRVFVQFVVNEKGEVTNAKVVRGVDPALDREALRVINNLPKWSPGEQRGKPVKVSFTVPINFMLAN
jgi:periplasmic protein TonB